MSVPPSIPPLTDRDAPHAVAAAAEQWLHAENGTFRHNGQADSGASLAEAAGLPLKDQDIRTPMAGILDLSRRLLQTSLTPEQRAWALAIHESGHQLLASLQAMPDANAGDWPVHPTSSPGLDEPPDGLGLTVAGQAAQSPEPSARSTAVPLPDAVPAGLAADPEAPVTLELLLVEDNAINQALAKALLTRMGHKVTIAVNGQDALACLARRPFDAVFMDCQMPVMDGFDATRAIRAGEAGVLQPQVHIVAMTVHATAGDHEKCMSAGMDDCVAKPINMDVLKHAVAAIRRTP